MTKQPVPHPPWPPRPSPFTEAFPPSPRPPADPPDAWAWPAPTTGDALPPPPPTPPFGPDPGAHGDDRLPPGGPEDAGRDDGDPSRTGAIWVTATGAFLVLAAAAVFVAVQWNQISDTIKFALLAAVTGACLIAGRRMRSALPATASVVYHLGALLLPINAAALLVFLDAPWPTHLLVQGVVAAVGFTLLNRTEQSVILRWGAAAGVVLIAGGLGALLHLPAALLLAAIAVVAYQVGCRSVAAAWALLAGFAPLLALLERFVVIDSAVVEQLGLVGRDTRLTSMITGGLAAFVLGRRANDEHDLLFVAFAALAGIIGVLTGWVEWQPAAATTWTGAAALFVVIEILAHLVRHDPFWAKPVRWLAIGAEAITGIIVLGAAWVAVPVWFAYTPSSFVAAPIVAGFLATVGWYLADLRRRQGDNTPTGIALLVGSGWWPATLGMAGAAFAGSVLGSPSLTVSGGVLLATAIFLVLSGRPLGQLLAVGLVTAAPGLAFETPVLAVAFALAGAIVVAGATVVRAQLATPTSPTEAGLLAAGATLPLLVGTAVAVGSSPLIAVLAVAATAAWSLGLIIDRASDDPELAWLGWIPRAIAVLTLAAGPALSPRELAWLAGGLTAAAIIDGLRRADPAIVGIAAFTMPVTVIGVVLAVGGSWPAVGVAFCAVAVVAGAVHLFGPVRWHLPAVAILASHAAIGLWLTLPDPKALGAGLILLGGLGAAYPLRRGKVDLAFVGLVAVLFGIWIELAGFGVTAIDAFVAPVAVVLGLAGWNARRDGAGSWVAYGPAVALFGGTALLERMSGAGAVHAVLVGALGVTAVLAGGFRRLSAPLILGTALLVLLTGYEAFAHTHFDLPTPAWLAIGGAILMAAGIAMERRDQGPIETGRRLVDVVHERFS